MYTKSVNVELKYKKDCEGVAEVTNISFSTSSKTEEEREALIVLMNSFAGDEFFTEENSWKDGIVEKLLKMGYTADNIELF